jgi:hypothetical protein
LKLHFVINYTFLIMSCIIRQSIYLCWNCIYHFSFQIISNFCDS